MSNLSQFFGGGGGLAPYYIVFEESAVYEFPKDMRLDVMVLGAGASGGVLKNTNHSSRRASGGGAGGLCIAKNLKATEGESVSIVIGAGGEARELSGTTLATSLDGYDGGQTSFVGLGRSLQANGGEKGLTTTSASNGEDFPGGNGGIASGGDVNLEGSAGLPTNNDGTHYANSGGGVSIDFQLFEESAAGVVAPKLNLLGFYTDKFFPGGIDPVVSLFNGGSPALWLSASSDGAAIAAGGVLGGGGGGAVNFRTYANSPNICRSGKGGNGLVVLRVWG